MNNNPKKINDDEQNLPEKKEAERSVPKPSPDKTTHYTPNKDKPFPDKLEPDFYPPTHIEPDDPWPRS